MGRWQQKGDYKTDTSGGCADPTKFPSLQSPGLSRTIPGFINKTGSVFEGRAFHLCAMSPWESQAPGLFLSDSKRHFLVWFWPRGGLGGTETKECREGQSLKQPRQGRRLPGDTLPILPVKNSPGEFHRPAGNQDKPSIQAGQHTQGGIQAQPGPAITSKPLQQRPHHKPLRLPLH